MVPSRDLIFDLGLFDGEDTAFYLGKGFRVVAVEAQPDFCRAGRARFSRELQSGQLTIVERALWKSDGERITFYIRGGGWSSVLREAAERDGQDSVSVEAVTITMPELFRQFGVPHYLKCDIEGGEDTVISQLAQSGARPNFISMEDPNGATATRLAEVGYDRFQMRNQGHHRLFKPPNPPREGAYLDNKFAGHSSGLFGFELPPKDWVDEKTLQRQLRRWHSLRDNSMNPLLRYACKRWGKLTRRGWLIPGGWSDVHATMASTLHAP